jgi:hypothetical protein
LPIYKHPSSNGELNDFEPMMKLSKFVEEESLAQMRFSRMTNNIRIENRDHLPYRKWRFDPIFPIFSSKASILLTKILITACRFLSKNLFRITRKQNFDQSARKGMNFMLKITGTTSDYSVSYDGEALKESIKNDILDERQEWKNIKNQDQSEEAPELEEEYFDFEEDRHTAAEVLSSNILFQKDNF